MAQKVYEGGWEAKTQQQLISRIQSKLLRWIKTKLCVIADREVQVLIYLKKMIFILMILISWTIIHEPTTAAIGIQLRLKENLKETFL